jgi:hypothetical protein
VRSATERERSPVLPAIEPGRLGQLRPAEYLIRFALGAAISIGSGLISLNLTARFGGSFLAFPSILPASLTLIQKKEGIDRADRSAVGAVLGAVGLVVFAMIGEAAFGHLNPFTALVLALAGWVVTAVALYGVLAFVRPETCDRNKD